MLTDSGDYNKVYSCQFSALSAQKFTLIISRNGLHDWGLSCFN